jgi:hypothetical protein
MWNRATRFDVVEGAFDALYSVASTLDVPLFLSHDCLSSVFMVRYDDP